VAADGSTTNGHTFTAKRESGDGRPASRDAQCTVGAAPKAAKHTDPSHWVGRIPRDGARHPVSDPLGLVVAVQMARRLRKRRVGATPHDDSILLDGHCFDDRARFVTKRLPRHPSGNSHHHVDDAVAVCLRYVGQTGPSYSGRDLCTTVRF
jgi:hypothetical protein